MCLLFVKEKLRGACTDLPENFHTAFFRTGDHSKGIRFFFSFFFEIIMVFSFVHTCCMRHHVFVPTSRSICAKIQQVCAHKTAIVKLLRVQVDYSVSVNGTGARVAKPTY